jgi:hypothetical protein
MNTKSMRVLALAGLGAGVFALAPSPASAFHGNLIHCTPTAGVGTVVTLKKGLTCTDATNKIQVKATGKTGNQFDGCVANAAAPWDAWAAGKFGSKISGAAAATITKADVTIKAVTFGSCNFSGDPDSATASGAGKIAFYDSGGNKVKGGKGSMYVRVAGDVPSQSAVAIGLMTKGIGVGAGVTTQVGINLAGSTLCGATPCNGIILGCNTGAFCPPDVPAPVEFLDLITDANSKLDISIQDNADCVNAGDPYPCCTGPGAGGC